MRFVHHRKRWLLSITLLALLLTGVWWWQVAEARSWHAVGRIDPAWAETPHAVEVDGKSIFLTLVDEKVMAFYGQDPHSRGCIVNWDAREQRFIDPCLGTTYEHDGTYVRGPSPRSLDRFVVRVTNNEVAINTSVITRGAPLNSPTIRERIQQWVADLW